MLENSILISWSIPISNKKSRLKKTMPKGDFFHISGQLMPQKWPSRYENNQNIVINMLPFHTFG
jgi:hypothetical protein